QLRLTVVPPTKVEVRAEYVGIKSIRHGQVEAAHELGIGNLGKVLIALHPPRNPALARWLAKTFDAAKRGNVEYDRPSLAEAPQIGAYHPTSWHGGRVELAEHGVEEQDQIAVLMRPLGREHPPLQKHRQRLFGDDSAPPTPGRLRDSPHQRAV